MAGLSKESFEAVAERVLRGEAAIETVEGIDPWPPVGGCEDRFLVLMHRDFPGCVALFGSKGDEIVLTGAYSAALLAACKSWRPKDFRFGGRGQPQGLAALSALLDAVAVSALEGVEAPFHLLCGVEGALLLSDLRAFWSRRSGEALH